jgi:dihydroorotase
MVGLESALSVVHAAVVEPGLLDWADVARVLSVTPARIGRISGQGGEIAAGAAAELTLYDPSVRRVFDRGDLAGLGANSPYLSMTLPGRVEATFHNGYATVLGGSVREGALVEQAAREAGRG